MRLIDADALLESERATRFAIGGRGGGKSLITLCRNYLYVHVTNAPTIDAVPVVRCKDCKYNHISLAFSRGGVWCECWGTTPDPDGFCHKGERRSDD